MQLFSFRLFLVNRKFSR